MRIFKNILALMVLPALFAGCIREDVSDCETPVDLEFLYFGDGIVDVFGEHIDSVQLYVYEMPSGRFVKNISVPGDALDKRQGTSLRLSPGRYNIICWGNLGVGSYVDYMSDEPKVGNLRYFETGEAPKGIEPLYYGGREVEVPMTLRPVKETVEYVSSHITIGVELLGFAGIGGKASGNAASMASDAVQPLVALTHSILSEYIDFNNVPSETTVDYVPELAAHPTEEDSYVTAYRVPRFDERTASVLTIRRNDTGETVYSRPFADIIEELGIKIGNTNELVINLKIKAWVEDGIVRIEVVGFNTEIVYPGW